MLDEIDRKIGLALWDAGMNVTPILTGYIVEIAGVKRQITLSEVPL